MTPELSQPGHSSLLQPARPAVVTAICTFFFFVGIVDYVYGLQSDDLRKMAPWCQPVLGIAGVVQLFAMIAVWNMKRWAVKVHAVALAVAFISTARLGFSPTIETIDMIVSFLIRMSPFFGHNRFMMIPLGVLHAAAIWRLLKM